MDDKPGKCFSKVLGPCDWLPADQPPAEEPQSPLFTAAQARIAELEAECEEALAEVTLLRDLIRRAIQPLDDESNPLADELREALAGGG